MIKNTYDVIIIGAGSVGLPTSLFLAKERLKVLVLDYYPSVGQGQNKSAIGGVRATHSDPAKIQTCLKSLEIFANWKDEYGDDIDFDRGGYTFPAYDEKTAAGLKKLLETQKRFGLNIDWLEGKDLQHVLPGIYGEGLLGGTYSPGDGHLSPLKVAASFHHQARLRGVEFRCGERVLNVTCPERGVFDVHTDKDVYTSANLINAAGAEARAIGQMLGIDLPVYTDCHEAGVTEAVKRFLHPMVVDIRIYPNSKNFYFYQNSEGHFIFCITPDPPILGADRRATSAFLPDSGQRLIRLFPKLQNVKIRRTWRGLYPMTPDGVPIIDKIEEIEGLYVAVGMCGQGLMLGPGVAANLTHLILHRKPLLPQEIFDDFSSYRDYSGHSEALR